jgi:DNA-binding XRE family transcriptional regulator
VCGASAEYCELLETDAVFTGGDNHGRGSRIGCNIQTLRQECGWSIEDLAGKVGVHRTTVLATINSGTKPQPKTLKAYADVFSEALQRAIAPTDLER